MCEEPIGDLSAHGAIPIAYVVDRVLDVSLVDRGLAGLRFHERPVDVPWVKDYDAIKGEGPVRWANRFDLTNWGLLGAFDGDTRVGGAVLAFDTPGVEMLRGGDVAALWDIRVEPRRRRAGVGGALFRAAEGWARRRGARSLIVETQNINVPACRFYARMGCTVAAINLLAYTDFPDEVQLVWSKAVGVGDVTSLPK